MPNGPLEKRSQSPLYQQLMTRIKNDVHLGVYPAGARIPSEQELCDSYGVSRVTVRKALLDLVQEGLLIRKQGKGTFVADERLQRNLQQITSFTDACRQLGRVASSRLIGIRRTVADADDVKRMGLEKGEELLEISRVRLCDGEPMMLEVNRFPAAYDYLEGESLNGSLYQLLREHGSVPAHALHDVSLGHATPTVCKYLGVAAGEALLVLDETVFDQHEKPLHLSRQWIRGDRFVFRI